MGGMAPCGMLKAPSPMMPQMAMPSGMGMPSPKAGFRPPFGAVAPMQLGVPIDGSLGASPQIDPALGAAAPPTPLQSPVTVHPSIDPGSNVEPVAHRAPKPSVKAQRIATPHQVAPVRVQKPAFVCLVDDFCDR